MKPTKPIPEQPPGSVATPATTAEGNGGKLPPELRFLVAQAADPEERQRIVRAFYTLAGGTPESVTVQFSLIAVALLRANLTAAQDVTEKAQGLGEHAARLSAAATAATSALPAPTTAEITAAVRQALTGMAEGLNVLSDGVEASERGRWHGVWLLLAGILIGYILARF